MADGQNNSPGDMKATERLKKYWTTGSGAAKIAWNTEGDWTRCVRYLSKYMTKDQAQGYCQNLHKRATGLYTGDKGNPGNRD